MNHDTDDEKPALSGEDEIRALVAVAEEVADPLDDLIERSETDPGEPFSPEVVEALADLRRNDQRRFESLRAELRRVGVRVAELDKAISQARRHPMSEDGQFESEGGDDVFSSIEKVELFHTPDGKAYADIRVGGHRETHGVETEEFAEWLAHQHYVAYREPPPKDDLNSALGLARYRAKFNGPERSVHVRVAELGDRFFLDLGDPAWRAIEISREGWHVIDEPPVRFIRPPGYGALPEPQRGASLELLWQHVNLPDENHRVLVAACLIVAFWPRGPYPVLVLSGEQGTAKSTLTGYFKLLVDPNAVPLRPMARNEQDLFIGATHAHLLAFDNLSRLRSSMSDALCRLATGGGFAARRLYSDSGEVLLNACRPVVINGIEDVIMRADLADRAVFIELARIEDTAREPENALLARFNSDRPLILGALLDALVLALREIDAVHLEKLPRMADFAVRAVASERAYAPSGAFLAAYERNRILSNENVIERDVVASAVATLVANRGEWRGTATGLLRIVIDHTERTAQKSQNFPQSASHLSSSLKRLATPLRAIGIEIESSREGHDRQRIITLRRTSAGMTTSNAPEGGADGEPSGSDVV